MRQTPEIRPDGRRQRRVTPVTAATGLGGSGVKQIDLGLRVRRVLGALALTGAIVLAPAQSALAHHYSNPADSKPCTNGYTPGARAPGISSMTLTGSTETGYSDERSGESHVRTVDGTLVGDVGAYSGPINNVSARVTATPDPGVAATATTLAVPPRTIAKFCRFFDDPFRRDAYLTTGSREYFTGSPGTGPGQSASSSIGHQYVQPGYYEPFAYAVDDENTWSDKAKRLIYINGPPTASFDYSGSSTGDAQALVNRPVYFRSSSKDHPAENGSLSYAWDLDGDGFDDGTASTASHTYSSEAARNIRLRVTDRWGTQRTESVPLAFDNLPPRPSFSVSPPNPELGQAVTFTSTSTDPDGTVAKVEWEFNGDGKYDDASGTTAQYVFPQPGRYPVSIRVSDERMPPRVAVLTQTIVVGELGQAAGAASSSASSAVAGTAGSTRATAGRRLAARVRLRAALTRRGAKLQTLAVSAERGAKLRVKCSGAGCRTRAQIIRSRGRLITFRRFQRSYGTGAVIQVFVTKSGRVGRYVRVTIRKGRAPLRKDACLTGSGSRPTRC